MNTNFGWAYSAGRMAWVQKEGSGSRFRTNKADLVNITDTSTYCVNGQNSKREASLWWPCILYPSWSYAANNSGFMCVDDENHSIQIEGCSRPTSTQLLRKNMVPQVAALVARHRSKNCKQNTPKRVVVYYLGMGYSNKDEISWAACDVTLLRPYNQVTSLHTLLSYQHKLHPSDWKHLKYAMEEAAVALLDPALKPQNLLRSSSDQDPGKCEEQTPEFYDEWKSQSQSASTQQTQFSQQTQQFGSILSPSSSFVHNTVSSTSVEKRKVLTAASGVVPEEACNKKPRKGYLLKGKETTSYMPSIVHEGNNDNISSADKNGESQKEVTDEVTTVERESSDKSKTDLKSPNPKIIGTVKEITPERNVMSVEFKSNSASAGDFSSQRAADGNDKTVTFRNGVELMNISDDEDEKLITQ